MGDGLHYYRRCAHHDNFARLDIPVGDKPNPLPGHLRRVEWQRYRLLFGRRCVVANDLGVLLAGDDDQAAPYLAVRKYACISVA